MKNILFAVMAAVVFAALVAAIGLGFYRSEFDVDPMMFEDESDAELWLEVPAAPEPTPAYGAGELDDTGI